MKKQDMEKKKGKIIVLSAPSGCGKSTIINTILDSGDYDLKFSVSATNRSPREGEVDGVHYHFLTTEEFRDAIAAHSFVEWEEVYPGRFYGTLRSEIERRIDAGDDVVLDIDVKGGLNVKKIFGDRALTIFILPPDLATLRQRLVSRGTDAPAIIEERLEKAEYEISFAPEYDCRVVNDNLDEAVAEVRALIDNFLKS